MTCLVSHGPRHGQGKNSGTHDIAVGRNNESFQEEDPQGDLSTVDCVSMGQTQRY